MEETIYKNGCWTCLRAREDPEEKYRCPKMEQHWIDWKDHEQWREKTYGE